MHMTRRKAMSLLIAAAVGVVIVGGTTEAEAFAPLSKANNTKSTIHSGTCHAPVCVSYRHHRTLRRTCRGCDCHCKPPQNVVLTVYDPCCCDRCLEIPLCIPACCCDVPCMTSRCGPLGRGYVTYTWACGFKAEVVFKRNGDVVVHTYGR